MSFSLKKNLFGVFAVVIIVVILASNFFPKEVRGYFYSISSPFQMAFLRASDRASDFLAYFSNAKILQKENEALTLRIKELIAENSSLKYIREENVILREALDVGLEKDFELALVKVIGKDLSQDSVLVNKGSADRIGKGMLVITGQRVLVGTVAEVYEKFSKVMLLSHKKSVADVEVSGKDIAGLIRGKGGLGAFLDLIPKNETLNKGDILVQRKLLVGMVEKITQSPEEPFQKAEISLFFNQKDLRNLFILLK